MARGRMISKSWSTSKKRAVLYRQAGPLAEFCLQLFPLLVVHSDDYGRLDADPETIKLVCDPGCPRQVEDFIAALEQMETVGLIQRYTADGGVWLQIVKFDEHQAGLLSKRTTPKSPSPPSLTEFPEDSGNSGLTKPNQTQLKKSGSAETSSAPPDALRGPVEARDGLTRGPVEARAQVPAFLTYPVVGPGPSEWALTEAQVAEWMQLFPGLDVKSECRTALVWVKADVHRRKTARGMLRFLAGWLTRSYNSGGARRAQAPPHGRVITGPQPHFNVPSAEETRRKYLGGVK